MSEGTCSIGGCTTGVYARGWCHRHYQRWWKYGDPLGFAPKLTIEQCFWRHVEKGESGCWEWTGGRSGSGYGTFFVRRKATGAHRWSYEHHVGPIPEGLEIDHLCANRVCVNPAHLEPVTSSENTRRAWERGRA